MRNLNDDPLSEPLTEREQAVLRLMAQGLSNRQIGEELILSLDTIKWYTKRLYEKLDVNSRTQAIARAEALGLLDKKAVITAQPHTHPPPKLNLPTQATRFIGREAELDDLAKLLNEDHVRLLTIVAPGGMGKTRLAMEAATLQDINFADGVYFIALAPLSSAEQIIPAIADGVGLELLGGIEPKLQLLNFLRAKSMLLLIDNFEHLLEGIEIVSDILAAAPNVKILITSREAVNLQEEFLYPLKGMQFPEHVSSENLENYSAIRLFAHHARRTRADFSLSDEQAGAAQICALVEGMPLGIELAATWIRALSCAEIANEIRGSLDILATPVRNVPERHRNMRAVLEQSWKRLTANEQAVFKNLSIFRGGFTRQAAQTVTGASLPVLAALVDKSLIRHHLEERYDIHELLRQYGEEQLNFSVEESEQARDRHGSYYAEFMQKREADVKGRRQLAALKEIEMEFENVRAAWLWGLRQHHYPLITDTLESLFLFCEMRGRFVEGGELFQQAAEHLASTENDALRPLWGRVMSRGMWVWELLKANDVQQRKVIQAQVQTCQTIAQEHGDQAQVAFCMWVMGCLLIQDDASSIDYLKRSLALFTEQDDRFYMARAADFLGYACESYGQNNDATRFSQQSLDLRRSLGDQFGIAGALLNLTDGAAMTGQYDEAERYVLEMETIYLEMGHRQMLARTRNYLALLAFQTGDFDIARKLADEAFDIVKNSGTRAILKEWVAPAILGMLAALREDYTQSWQFCEQTVQWGRDSSADPHEGFAIAACGLGDYATAKLHFAKALKYGLTVQNLRRLTTVLPVGSILMAREGQHERAVEILGLVFHHPASPKAWLEQWPLLTHLRTSLQNQLGEQSYEAAWECGKTHNLEIIAGRLLSEISG